jgi:formylglycine-generating enzyme required for sulfatase activity
MCGISWANCPANEVTVVKTRTILSIIRAALLVLAVLVGATYARAGGYEDMVLIPGGEFVMGSFAGDADERPEHRVFVKDFFIDCFEVTNDDFAAFLNRAGNQVEDGAPYLLVGATDCRIQEVKGSFVVMEGYGDHPVTMVTYRGAEAYAKWVGKRLPTEAEWEKAARGGLVGKYYPWGDDIDTLSANYGRKRMGTTPAGSFAPNGFGLYDMAGNAAEMVADYYDPRYYRSSPAADPQGPATGAVRVVKGGSWLSNAAGVGVCVREPGPPVYIALPNVGFRCAGDAR